MALCQKCGSKIAFGAKRSVAPALEVTAGTLTALRKASAELPGPDEFSITDPAERAEFDKVRSKFLKDMGILIRDGVRLESALHVVAHNMRAAYIDWPEVNSWLKAAHNAVAAAHNY